MAVPLSLSSRNAQMMEICADGLTPLESGGFVLSLPSMYPDAGRRTDRLLAKWSSALIRRGLQPGGGVAEV